MAIGEMVAGECEEVVLEAEVSNTGALALYRSLGFIRDKHLHRCGGRAVLGVAWQLAGGELGAVMLGGVLRHCVQVARGADCVSLQTMLKHSSVEQQLLQQCSTHVQCHSSLLHADLGQTGDLHLLQQRMMAVSCEKTHTCQTTTAWQSKQIGCCLKHSHCVHQMQLTKKGLLLLLLLAGTT
jgi:hypothetical protein